MRRLVLLLLLPLCACGRRSASVEGTLAEGLPAAEVWALGAGEGAPVEDGRFQIRGLRGDTVELRFAAGDDTSRMRLAGIPSGAELHLESVWARDGVAFPSRVHLRGGSRVLINGIWMGESAVPEAVNAPATVLAASSGGDAFLVRPTGPGLPDLRVLVTPGTIPRAEDGDPVDISGLEFGDSLRVVGDGRSGFVVATELILPRPLRGGDDDEDGGREPAEERRGDDSGADREQRDKEKRGRGERPGERGRGKGRGRGRG